MATAGYDARQPQIRATPQPVQGYNSIRWVDPGNVSTNAWSPWAAQLEAWEAAGRPPAGSEPWWEIVNSAPEGARTAVSDMLGGNSDLPPPDAAESFYGYGPQQLAQLAAQGINTDFTGAGFGDRSRSVRYLTGQEAQAQGLDPSQQYMLVHQTDPRDPSGNRTQAQVLYQRQPDGSAVPIASTDGFEGADPSASNRNVAMMFAGAGAFTALGPYLAGASGTGETAQAAFRASEIAAQGGTAGNVAGATGGTIGGTGLNTAGSTGFWSTTPEAAATAAGGTAGGTAGATAMPWWESVLGSVASSAGSAALSSLLAPDAPDYAAVAAEQGRINQQTAEQQAAMNRLDENTPFGSVRYSRVPDPTQPGGFRYTRDTTLSPEQQSLYDLSTNNQIASQRTAQGLQQGVRDSVSRPFSLSGIGGVERVEEGPSPFSLGNVSTRDLYGQQGYAPQREQVVRSVYNQYQALRQPALDRQLSQLDTTLRNQGLLPGSAAYNTALQELRQAQSLEMNDLTERAVQMGGAEQSRLAGIDLAADQQGFGQRQTAYENSLNQIRDSLTQRLQTSTFNNTARQQEVADRLLERNQPLAEYNAFQTGNQPTTPQFQGYGQTSYQPTNVSGAANSQYQADADRANLIIGGAQSGLNAYTAYQSRTPSRPFSLGGG